MVRDTKLELLSSVIAMEVEVELEMAPYLVGLDREEKNVCRGEEGSRSGASIGSSIEGIICINIKKYRYITEMNSHEIHVFCIFLR